MEKISGIIPSTPRVTNVDMKDAQPSRAAIPGDRAAAAAVGAGAVSKISEQMSGSAAWKSKEARQAALASEVSNNFFMKNKPEPESDSGTFAKELPSKSQPMPEGHLAQPEGLFPKGSFIDRNA